MDDTSNMIIQTRIMFALRGFMIAMAIILAPAASPALAAKITTPDQLVLTQEERAEIKRVNAYLNKITHLEGDFVQIGPDGQISEGRFYLRRPGRMRFSYKQPNPILVVADGFWIGITNSRLKTTDRFPIRATPLWALLEKRVDLIKNTKIMAVNLEPDTLTITIQDAKGKANGELTLIFSNDDIELKQWIIKDPQGLITTVSLSNLVMNKPARNAYFIIKDITPTGSAYPGANDQ